MAKTLLVCSFIGIFLIGLILFPAPAYAGVGATPSSINFGSVTVSTSSTGATITITNTSRQSVSIEQVTSSLAQFAVLAPAMPLYIAPRSSTSFQVVFTPSAATTFSGNIVITPSHKAGGPISIGVSGVGLPSNSSPTQTYLLSASASSLSFGNILVGSSASQAFTVSNTGTGSVNISQIAVTGAGFTVSGFPGAVTLAAGQSLPLTANYSPAVAGAAVGSISIVSTGTNTPMAISLSGTGTPVTQTYQLSFNPTAIVFGNQPVYSSNSLPFTLTNTGTGSVSISQVAITGSGFSLSGFSGAATLAAGQSLSLTASFAPTATGSVSGSVSVVSTATNSPATIPMSGSGVKPLITVIPSSVAFGNVTVGVTNTQTITVQNPGSGTLNVTQASMSPSGFSLSGLTLPLAVAAGGSATFNVGFTPASAGSLSGSLTLTNNATNPGLSIPLSGSGVASSSQLSVNPTSLSFGSRTMGTSATQTLTLTNTGNSSVSISQVSESGAGFSTNGMVLPLSLAVGQSTSFTVTFAPASAGSLSGSVTVVSNATNSPLVITLSGTGAAAASHTVSLSWTPGSSTYSGFNVYRGATSGGPYARVDTSAVSSTSYLDASVTSGQTYYYVATEVDNTGTESAYSSEVSAVIP